MNHKLSLALAAALAAASPGLVLAQAEQAADSAVEPVSGNPFFVVSNLPYQAPRFDLIKNEHYQPALERGMAEQRAEVDAIANNPEAPTFENTIVALEKTGSLLNRAGAVFGNLAGAHTNPEIQKVQAALAPKFAAHQDAIVLDGKLFARIKSLHDKRDSLGLDDQSKRLLERYHTDFIRAGANL